MPSSSLLVSLSAEFALGESSGWFWLSGEMVSFLSFFFMSCGCLVALVLSIFFLLFVCLCVRDFVFVHVLCLCLLIYSYALYLLSSFPSFSVAMVFTFKGKRNCTFCRTAACKV